MWQWGNLTKIPVFPGQCNRLWGATCNREKGHAEGVRSRELAERCENEDAIYGSRLEGRAGTFHRAHEAGPGSNPWEWITGGLNFSAVRPVQWWSFADNDTCLVPDLFKRSWELTVGWSWTECLLGSLSALKSNLVERAQAVRGVSVKPETNFLAGNPIVILGGMSPGDSVATVS